MKEQLKIIGDFLKKHKAMNRRQKAQFYVQGAGVVFLFFIVLGVCFSIKAPRPAASVSGKIKAVSLKETASSKAEGSSLLLGDDVDQKSYVAKIESQYYAAADKSQSMEQKISDLSQQVDRISKAQEDIAASVAAFDGKLTDAVSKIVQSQQSQAPGGMNSENYSLEVTKIAEINTENKKAVYLPAGSFVKGTLLTGVYAPSQQSNPLPVLIRLKEAFYGPNESRINLEGAFAIGKATGDMTSERALIQITTLSAVLPSGQAFEQKGNLGYLTDITGQLGLKGIVVRNTGSQLALSFLSGFMSGGAQALANQQTTSELGTNGQITSTVTGSTGKNALFSGFAASAGKMSDYYSKQLEQIIPAIKVDAGVDVYFVVLEGVKINGLTTDGNNSFNYID